MKPFKTLCVVLLAAMLVLTTAACGSRGKTNDNLQTGGSASQKQDKKTIVCSADYPEYTSVDDLSAHADYVVYGTVLSERYESMSLRIPESGAESAEAGQDNEQTVVTVYEVRVQESYSGAASFWDEKLRIPFTNMKTVPKLKSVRNMFSSSAEAKLLKTGLGF